MNARKHQVSLLAIDLSGKDPRGVDVTVGAEFPFVHVRRRRGDRVVPWRFIPRAPAPRPARRGGAARRRPRFGERLVSLGLLSPAALEAALAAQRSRSWTPRLGELLIERGAVAEDVLMPALAEHLGTPLVRLPEPVGAIAHLVPEHICQRHRMVPIARRDGVLTLAMADPLNLIALDDVRLMTGLRVEPVLASAADVQRSLENAFGTRAQAARLLDQVRRDPFASLVEDAEEVSINDAPIIRLVNILLVRAIEAGATEVHLEAGERDLRAFARTEGELVPLMDLPLAAADAVFRRIAVLCNLRARAAHGRTRLLLNNRAWSLSAHVVQSVRGPHARLKLHPGVAPTAGATDLGLEEDQLAPFADALAAGSGLVLIAGPPGAGRSTALHVLLTQLRGRGQPLALVEDPVERELEGVVQIEPGRPGQETRAACVDAALALAPGALAIDEIGEPDVARRALYAARSGVLVLAGMRAPDAWSAMEVLLERGVPRAVVAGAVSLAVSLRLARRAGGGQRGLYEVVPLSGELARPVDGQRFPTLADIARRRIAAGELDELWMRRLRI